MQYDSEPEETQLSESRLNEVPRYPRWTEDSA
jgi:hypothetical protein